MDNAGNAYPQECTGSVYLLPKSKQQTMSQWDRCISRRPTEMFSVNYNNAYQIIQTETHVVIHSEMIREARIIPLQGAHADARVRGWNGDSRGHWDGDTLVVESSNFNGTGWIATGRNWGRLYGVPSTEKLRITERFTRLDAKTLRYQVTVEDPEIYTAPWTLSYPLTLDNDYRIYEYACHEGNEAIEMILRGARTQERDAGGCSPTFSLLRAPPREFPATHSCLRGRRIRRAVDRWR